MHSPRAEWFRYVASTTTTIANTTVETTQFPAGAGSLVLEPENLQTGMTYRVRLRGYISTQNTVDAVIRVKLGSTVILESTGSLPAAMDDVAIDFDAEIRVCLGGASGHVCINGMTRNAAKDGVGTISGRSLNAVAVDVDMSTAKTLDVTYQWGTAHATNSLTVTHATVEVWS